MKIDDLKYKILAQHHLIRALLVDIGDVAQMVAAGDTSCEADLRKGAHQLADELLRHMADEERLLEALVREGYAPAAEHLADLQHNHLHQRTLIDSFSVRVDSVHSTRRLGEIVEAMVHAVVLDMDHEEGAIFGSQSLVPVPMPMAAVA
jgi:iron-sulfur cluster repair protein YtfE (RIC family)